MRGLMSGPMSSDVSNCVLSLASPGVRWKSRAVEIGLEVDFGREAATRAADGIRVGLTRVARLTPKAGDAGGSRRTLAQRGQAALRALNEDKWTFANAS
jgi:hypothetical protein